MAEKHDPNKDSNKVNLFYLADNGEWKPLGPSTDLSMTFKATVYPTEEEQAKMAAVLEPLGDLEIVPNNGG